MGGDRMTKIEKLLEYQYQMVWKAQNLIMQANPHTAIGDGLNDISRALGLGGRYDVPYDAPDSWNDGCTHIDEFREETDSELRQRILDSLRSSDG
jgi:hypothetical protein